MKQFLLLILSFIFFSINAMESPQQTSKGTVVFLRATQCRDRKICQALMASSITWKMVSDDDTCMSTRIDDLYNRFPTELHTIDQGIERKNIFHAIVRFELLYMPQTTDEKKAKIRAAIEKIRKFEDDPINYQQRTIGNEVKQRIIQRIRNFAQAGYLVINDSWYLKEEDFNSFKSDGYNVFHVYAYTCLSELIKRHNQRNKEALYLNNLGETRFYEQTLSSFKKLQFSTNPDGAIDWISRNNIIEQCKGIESQLTVMHGTTRPLSSRREMTKEELQLLKDELLSKCNEFGTYIHPDAKYDLIVNCSAKEPERVAELIDDLVKKH